MREFHFEDILMGSDLLLHGLTITIGMSVIVIVLSLLFGTILGVLRHEGPVWLARIVALVVEFVRSIPLILFMVFVHYGLMYAINSMLGRDSSFLESAIIALTLFEAAYIAEIFRGGLRSIQTTEREAASSLGLTYMQRLWFVFLPLAYSRTIPALIGQFISLVKDTSLASIIGVTELTRQGEILYQNTFHDFEVLVFIALVYFIICFSLSRLSRRFEFGSRPEQTLTVAAVQG